MLIAIAGPYSAETADKRQANLDRLNDVAKTIFELGHTPIIGVNVALPIALKFEEAERYKVIMDISLKVVANCDALFLVSESPGAMKEYELIISQGKPVFRTLEEIQTIDFKNNNDND